MFRNRNNDDYLNYNIQYRRPFQYQDKTLDKTIDDNDDYSYNRFNQNNINMNNMSMNDNLGGYRGNYYDTRIPNYYQRYNNNDYY